MGGEVVAVVLVQVLPLALLAAGLRLVVELDGHQFAQGGAEGEAGLVLVLQQSLLRDHYHLPRECVEPGIGLRVVGVEAVRGPTLCCHQTLASYFLLLGVQNHVASLLLVRLSFGLL